MADLRWMTVLGVLLVAACTPGNVGPPRSTLQVPTNDEELEPSNSLPPGFITNHPLAPASGVVGVTRTAP